MGMFDYVNFVCDCPKCGADVDDFQTKDTDCSLDVVSPSACSHFYSQCSECGIWIDCRWETLLDQGAHEGAIRVQQLSVKWGDEDA